MTPDDMREKRSLRWGQERDRLFLELRGAAPEKKVRAYLALEKALLKGVVEEEDRLELKRRITEDILRACSNGPWRIFERYWRRMQQLGFTTLDRKLLALIFLAEAARTSPAARQTLRSFLMQIQRLARTKVDWSVTPEEIERAVIRARRISGLDDPGRVQ